MNWNDRTDTVKIDQLSKGDEFMCISGKRWRFIRREPNGVHHVQSVGVEGGKQEVFAGCATVVPYGACWQFAIKWGMNIDRVGQLVRLAKECVGPGVRECNGDPHPLNPTPSDKDKNAQLWGHVRDVCAADLLRFAETYGFTEVVFDGLYPSLKKGDQQALIPYEG